MKSRRSRTKNNEMPGLNGIMKRSAGSKGWEEEPEAVWALTCAAATEPDAVIYLAAVLPAVHGEIRALR